MTVQAIDKLPDVNRKAFERMRKGYKESRALWEESNHKMYENMMNERKNAMKGYIICLKDMGIINQIDMNLLIVYSTI